MPFSFVLPIRIRSVVLPAEFCAMVPLLMMVPEERRGVVQQGDRAPRADRRAVRRAVERRGAVVLDDPAAQCRQRAAGDRAPFRFTTEPLPDDKISPLAVLLKVPSG